MAFIKSHTSHLSLESSSTPATSNASSGSVVVFKKGSTARRTTFATVNLRNPSSGPVITYGESSSDEDTSSDDARSDGYWRWSYHTFCLLIIPSTPPPGVSALRVMRRNTRNTLDLRAGGKWALRFGYSGIHSHTLPHSTLELTSLHNITLSNSLHSSRMFWCLFAAFG